MAGTFNLIIVAPNGQVFNKDVEFVVVPGEVGELGFLPNHAPLIAGLGIGVLRYTENGKVHKIAIGGGFVEVANNQVTVLARAAEKPENIDIGRAQAAKERAEKRLRERTPDVDLARAEFALKRAMVRLSTADRH